MNEVQIFNNPDFGEIRTINIDGEPWFVGRDVASALGYKKPETSIRDRVREKDTEKFVTPTSSGNQEMIYINESGLYRLIFGSKLSSAEKFQDWVYDDVLPTLRKTGAYQMPQTNEQKIQLIAQGYVEIKQDVENVKSEIKELKDKLPIFLNEAQLVTDAVKRKGVVVMGGKDADAYSDRGIRCSVYHDIYAELYRQFGITSYKALKRNQLQMALDVIKAYVPAIVVKNLVDNANNQQRLEV